MYDKKVLSFQLIVRHRFKSCKTNYGLVYIHTCEKRDLILSSAAYASLDVQVVMLLLLFQIDHINLVMDNETGRSKGFGFVTVSMESTTHGQCPIFTLCHSRLTRSN